MIDLYNRTFKRSPIFWGLLALVLYYNGPLLVVMLPSLFGFIWAWGGALIGNQPLGLPETISLMDIFMLFSVSIIINVTLAASIAAVLSLVFKKYRAAMRLIITACTCCVVALIGVSVTKLAGTPLQSFSWDILLRIAEYLAIGGALFFYARKYQQLEKVAAAA